MNLAAYQGLAWGDLTPLITLLRSSTPIGRMVRREIVHALEQSPEALIHLEPRRTRTGPGSKAAELHTMLRRKSIAHFVDAHIKQQGDKKKMEAAVQAAMTEFDVSRSLVMDACKQQRQFIKNAKAQLTSELKDKTSPGISCK